VASTPPGHTLNEVLRVNMLYWHKAPLFVNLSQPILHLVIKVSSGRSTVLDSFLIVCLLVARYYFLFLCVVFLSVSVKDGASLIDNLFDM